VSVCLSVCLCRVFLSRLWPDFDQTWTYVICLGLVVSPRIWAVRPLGTGWPLKTCIFRGFGAQKTSSSYSFDRIVLIFGYFVERTNTKILLSHFFAISILNPNYDVINDVNFRFCKSCCTAMQFSPLDSSEDFMGEMVSVFLYLL